LFVYFLFIFQGLFVYVYLSAFGSPQPWAIESVLAAIDTLKPDSKRVVFEALKEQIGMSLE
jgi:hypothetical protein